MLPSLKRRLGTETLQVAEVPEPERPREAGPAEEPLQGAAVVGEVGEDPHGGDDQCPDQECSPEPAHRDHPRAALWLSLPLASSNCKRPVTIALSSALRT